ncbi:hypothetical protein [Sphingomonas abietis]|uniref:Uncharacterized protein n=1 Tax=Sphingomonas abietis TaxID=3012344 RepID=A0ABY7NI26_9SPHN|nr:hypothetical protein [Sphingomonas abietis]WBO21139.1 hypothetical protein PBT88_13135 [Sphingomonas abietis]
MAGGHGEGAVAGGIAARHDATIVGHRGGPPLVAVDASVLSARKPFNFLSAFRGQEQGRPGIEAAIGDAIRPTQGGQIVNPRFPT